MMHHKIKIHAIYPQASHRLGETAKWSLCFCGGESTSLFSLRKTLKAFIAILLLLQNLEGLEKDSSLFLEKLCTCHNTTIAFACGAAS